VYPLRKNSTQQDPSAGYLRDLRVAVRSQPRDTILLRVLHRNGSPKKSERTRRIHARVLHEGDEMTTQQPTWKFAGRVGDADPIAYGGGFVYRDATGVYPPELTLFEPASDEFWHRTGGGTPVRIFRIIIERNLLNEWWWKNLQQVANATGRSRESLQEAARDGSILEQAQLYSDLISHFGPYEFDQDPVTMTEDQAYAKYAAELKLDAEEDKA
jgi:hypothetical protein